MPLVYPQLKSDRFAMRKQGPLDHGFVVPGGNLLYNKNRDGRFPYLYELSRHPLVAESDYGTKIRHILVYIQKTDPESLRSQFLFEETLNVPKGPDAEMEKNGQSTLPTPMIHADFIYLSKCRSLQSYRRDYCLCSALWMQR
jgi:hypothetical protein